MARKPTDQKSVTVILLAAGASSRMRGRDKLLEKIDDKPLLSRVAETCLASKADAVIAVIRPTDSARRAALPAQVKVAINTDWHHGMASSLGVGLQRRHPDCPAILVVLADMPDISINDINALIAAFDPDCGTSICQAVSSTNIPGHPVLFGRAHFAQLAALRGDRGAAAVIAANKNSVKAVQTSGQNALTDLDTPQDWAAYRQR